MWFESAHFAWSQDKQKYAFVKTLLLNLWQEQEDPTIDVSMPSNALYDRSICSCLDEYEARSFAYSETVAIRDALRNNVQAFINNFNAKNTLETEVWTWLMYLHDLGSHQSMNLVDEFQTLMPILEKSTGFQPNVNVTASEGANMTRHSNTVQTMVMNLITHVKLANIQRDLLRELPFTRLEGMSEHSVYDFCSVTSASPYTIKYEGGADVWLMLFIGQFLLLISCIYSFERPFIRSHLFGQYGPMAFLQSNCHDTEARQATEAMTPAHEEHEEEKKNLELFVEGKTQFFLSVLRIVLLITVIAIAWQTSSTHRNDEKWNIDDRNDPTDSSMSSVFTNPRQSLTFATYVTCAFLLLLLVCEFVYAWYHYNYKIRSRYSGTLTETVSSDLLKLVCRDLCVIVALYVLSIAIVILTGAKETVFLKTVSTTVLVVAFLQHISNVFNYALDLLGAWLQAHQQTGKKHAGHNLFTALHDASSSSPQHLHAIDLEKMGEVIVRFCWFRAAVIALVIVASVLILFFVHPSQVPDSTTYLAGIQRLAFCVTLVLVLVGYDFFYETLSIGSAAKSYNSAREMKHAVHTYIVCLFIILSSFVGTWANP